MSRSDIHLVNGTDEVKRQFSIVMRRLAGGVSIITAGCGDDITGMTVTSLTSLSATCAYRKSHPAILMVQSAQDRAADDIPSPLNAARDRGILVQRQMS